MTVLELHTPVPEVLEKMRYRPATVVLLLAVMVLPLLLSACGKTVGDNVDDATITTRVKTALLNDPEVGGLRIDVDTALGVVTLSGIAKSRAEEQKAVAVARRIPGVKDVKSTLQINPGGA